ncbi:MAG TPA: hypothetical protein VGN12_30570 [Pirellulales bacterium]|jgi:hypothetical protein
MKDSFVAKFESKDAESNVIQLAEAEAQDNLGVCGLLRGIRDRAIMLELRLRGGRVEACGYMWLDNATFDPSEGITLYFARKVVKISGRNLDTQIRPGVNLFEALLRHRVTWLREADLADQFYGKIAIERIEVEQLGG